MRLVIFTWILIMLFHQCNTKRKHRVLREGEGMHFPKRQLTTTTAERYVFSRQTYAMYRLANPLFPPGELINVDYLFDYLSNGDLNTTLRMTVNDTCVERNFVYEHIPGEGNGAVYKWGPFFTTGQEVTISFFSCNPDDYVFIFACLDRRKEIVRKGRRVFCDGPWSILFFVYEYPPNQVRWCAAEKDLWNNYRLSFDNPCNRFLRTGEPCPPFTSR